MDFPNPNDLTSFTVTVTPDSGFWVGAKYVFTIVIPANYPHSPPKVTCTNKIYHPNINFEGNVCLNILREDWKPVLDINAVIYGLIYLFYEPNPDDPLNREAADLFRSDRAQVTILSHPPQLFSSFRFLAVRQNSQAHSAGIFPRRRSFREIHIKSR